MSRPGVVLAHDSLTAYGGGERTLESLFAVFPDAPLFTAIFRPPAPLTHQGSRAVHTSFLQYAPLPTHLLKPLFPLAFDSLRAPRETDVLLSSSSGYAKGMHHPRATLIAYIHTPIRRVWNTYHRAARHRPRGPLRIAEAASVALLRRWDVRSMQRVHHLIANSRNTAGQIERIYNRPAAIIPPPVRTSFFVPAESPPAEDYFLVVARLDPYKRVDLAIAACAALRRRLIIVGDGVDRQRLGRLAGPEVTMLGAVDDVTLRSLYQGCRALLFPGEEDFGIAPVEAQACGRPVVAFAAGGALETVVDGVTGVLFDAQTVEAAVAAMERVERLTFDREHIRRHAEQFDDAAFQQRIRAYVDEAARAPRRVGTP